MAGCNIFIIVISFRFLITVNQVYLAAIKFGRFATFWVIIEVFSYIILFNFCPNAKKLNFNSMPNLVDLQYLRFMIYDCVLFISLAAYIGTLQLITRSISWSRTQVVTSFSTDMDWMWNLRCNSIFIVYNSGIILWFKDFSPMEEVTAAFAIPAPVSNE